MVVAISKFYVLSAVRFMHSKIIGNLKFKKMGNYKTRTNNFGIQTVTHTNCASGCQFLSRVGPVWTGAATLIKINLREDLTAFIAFCPAQAR